MKTIGEVGDDDDDDDDDDGDGDGDGDDVSFPSNLSSDF